MEKIVIVGGVQLFEESYFHPWFQTLHLTEIIDQEFDCDTFLSAKMIEDLKAQQKQDSNEREKIWMKKDIVEDMFEENGVKYR